MLTFLCVATGKFKIPWVAYICGWCSDSPRQPCCRTQGPPSFLYPAHPALLPRTVLEAEEARSSGHSENVLSSQQFWKFPPLPPSVLLGTHKEPWAQQLPRHLNPVTISGCLAPPWTTPSLARQILITRFPESRSWIPLQL